MLSQERAGGVVDIAFDLPERYRESNAFLTPARGAPVPEAALQRVREHCARHGIQMPA